jgi:hypothetical protein
MREVCPERMFWDELAAALLAEYAAHKPAQRRPCSFGEIEEIWAREILPVLKDFKSMGYGEHAPPPAESLWHLNYAVPERIS